MRRLSVIFVVSAALAVPAAALAAQSATGDGSLVVKNGSAPAGTPVVVLKNFTGSVIGQIDRGKLVIDVGPNADPDQTPQVTGNAIQSASTKSETAQVWQGTNFKFRAVGGKNITVLVYGSGVDLVAVGKGSAKLAGVPDTPVGDGKYSLNGDDFVSLPGVQTKLLTIGSAA